jgi:uncharacterized protein Yka (UPF0111/DUF47 family)
MVEMDRRLEKKIDDAEARFKTEMSSGVNHMRKFEGSVKDLVKGLEHAHNRLDRRGVQMRQATEKIRVLEERCDTLTGQVGVFGDPLFGRTTNDAFLGRFSGCLVRSFAGVVL